MSAETVWVTGAAGFTGRCAVAQLQQLGKRVVTFTSSASEAHTGPVCDLTRRNAVMAAVQAAPPPDWVLHLAAISFVAHGDPEAFYRVNVLGTLNVLEALATLKQPPRKILIASSANVYGTPNIGSIHEGVCPAPVNHYACSKLAMEHMVRTWMPRLPIVMTRPFNYTGVGQDEKFLIPKIVAHFQRKAPRIELGNLHIARDFSDVRDVIAAYLRLLESDAAVGQTVNICSGRAHSLLDIIDIAKQLTGHDLEIHVNPQFVRSNEVPRLTGDPALLHTLIGAIPSIPLEHTLRWMLDTPAKTA